MGQRLIIVLFAIMSIITKAAAEPHRMSAKASSAFDYNLTAQLLVDGIRQSSMPPTLAVYSRDGLLPRRERECTIDGGDWTRVTLMGSDNFLQYEWKGMTVRADRIGVTCMVAYDERLANGGYDIRIVARDAKGKAKWITLAEKSGEGLPGEPMSHRVHSDPNKRTEGGTLPVRRIHVEMPLQGGLHEMSDVRVELRMKGAAYWTVTRTDFVRDGQRLTTELLPLSRFGSAWLSNADTKQWVRLDLNAATDVDGLTIYWLKKAAEGCVETSLDGKVWTRVAELPGGKAMSDTIRFNSRVRARYVRIFMTKPLDDKRMRAWSDKCAYAISEIEVDCGDKVAAREPQAAPAYADGRLSLNGDGWLLQRDDKAAEAIPATVPGTVLTSYINLGMVPDPNVADNIFDISDSFFYSDFWYSRNFTIPKEMMGKRIMLNLDGVNWKAEVWVNGKKADFIEGAFVRGKTDITPYLTDGTNSLAIKIIKNEHPGIVKEKTELNTDFNGGILGADNPTFHAVTGWDWISTVRGRDIGLWNDVYLTATDNVTLDDPVVTTRVDKATGKATMTPRVVVRNLHTEETRGTLKGWIGDIVFEKRIVIGGGEKREVGFEPKDFVQLADRNMRLWWPNVYGEPYLYDAGFEFVADGGGMENQRIGYKCGIREVECRDAKSQLKMYVNGVRITPLGGNWGFPEQNLRFGKREYDIAVGYHRDMNFNMIRNWVGMTGDEEFYDACDSLGIMVWHDFWLANPADGPDPYNEAMFIDNARDFTSRMRRHPSIALYCGRNEGYPPASIDKALRQIVGEANPGLTYISSSADEGVSGHGPYWAEPPRSYFEKQTGKLHSEQGMPNILTLEGLKRTLGEDNMWPQNVVWGQHDFTMAGAQCGAEFNNIVERMFGKATSAKEFTEWAQWENYDGYRAMYEAGSKDRQGLLIWMSHSCWPSLTWQCYDYYFEPTAAFFACKKACEPLHIQWNALTRDVEVVNRSGAERKCLTARREIMDMWGNCIRKDSTELTVVAADTTAILPMLHVGEKPEGLQSKVFYIRLSLQEGDGNALSDNFYVCSTEEGNLQELHSLPKTCLGVRQEKDGECRIVVDIKNEGGVPAMMVRLNLKDADGEQILPVRYDDNFFHLMPGEARRIRVAWNASDGKRNGARVEVTGFNVGSCQ